MAFLGRFLGEWKDENTFTGIHFLFKISCCGRISYALIGVSSCLFVIHLTIFLFFPLIKVTCLSVHSSHFLNLNLKVKFKLEPSSVPSALMIGLIIDE